VLYDGSWAWDGSIWIWLRLEKYWVVEIGGVMVNEVC
jgi:hypothetical protein